MKGDHISIDCDFYTHHGIDCGDGTVIHFSKATGEGKITRDSLSFFKSSSIDGNLYVHPYKQCDLPLVVIQRAMSKLGEGEYHLGWNNCEHFSTWCKTGDKNSYQVDDCVENSLATTTLVGIGMAVGTLPGAAICGLAFLVYKFFIDDENHNRKIKIQ